MKEPRLSQRKLWHPKARSREIAVRRLTTLIARLRYDDEQEYNADIAEFEVLPFLRRNPPARGKKGKGKQ